MALIVIAVVLVVLIVTRSKYQNKSNAGAFFFENNCLVLNSAVPYPIPLDEIECVELHCNSWELEHKWSYHLKVRVVRKDGSSKSVFYKGYRTAKLALPSDMEAALQEQGVRCVMIE